VFDYFLVHNKHVDALNLSLLIFDSLGGVGDDMKQPKLLLLILWTPLHVVSLRNVDSFIIFIPGDFLPGLL